MMLYRSNIVFIFTLILTLIVGFSFYAYNNPKHSWDTIPYVALVLSYENTDPKEIHNQTYELLKKTCRQIVMSGLLKVRNIESRSLKTGKH